MNVGRRMSHPVITISPEDRLTQAHKLITQEKIRQLPVVRNGKLVGIISRSDILKAYPSSVTSLSVWEITSLLEKITVRDIMIAPVISVTEDTSIEQAARIMVDKKIRSLPVVRGEDLIGIITEADLFRVMLEMLGGRRSGVRFTASMPWMPGEIAKITSAIFEKGGDITALSTFEGDSSDTFIINIKVDGIELQELRELIQPLVIDILSVSED